MLSCRQNLASRRRRGFSLLEMMVVGIVGVVLLGFIGNAWRWYTRGAHAVQVSTRLTKELKLAIEAMAADFGPSIAARTTDGGNVQFNIDGGAPDGVAQWASPDTIVEYAITSNRLIRHDLSTGQQIPMAEHITGIDAQVVSGVLVVTVTAGYGDEERSINVNFKEPG
jgi:prepilin-type N-terminal cleavage/methylation domain-containing protein